MMYYYKRKSNPFKWVIIIIIFMALGALVYWFYYNYFSRIEINKPSTEENLNTLVDTSPKILSGEIGLIKGDVQIDVNQTGYAKAIDQAVLHQGDKIKTGENSLAVLSLDDETKIRLGANTEIILTNLAEENVLLELLNGRIYNNITTTGTYQIKSLKTVVTALGTKFEVFTNAEQQYLAVLVFANKVQLEIKENEEVVLSSRLDVNEKGLINLKAAKKDMFKLETIDPKVLAKEAWYKWNFDQDQGVAENLPDLESDFEVLSDSLNLTVSQTSQGINLAWTSYNKDNFSSYKIIWSGSDSDLKYPGSEVVKSLADKAAVSYVDTKFEPDKKYYYRICVVKTSNKISCGNVAEIQTAEKDSVAPAAPILSATVSVAGVNLNWTKNTEDDFKEYRILKSITDANPSFPTAGYLVKKASGQETYLDTEVNITYPYTVYYRICSFDTSLNFSCSNVVTVEQGAIK